MRLQDCFRYLAGRQTDQLIVTSAGSSSSIWWDVTHDAERVFYLEASMGMVSMLAAGLALAVPAARLWAFNGDGAFIMNPGVVMVENRLRPPNLVHFVVSNRVYGATSEVDLPNAPQNDFALMARSMGAERVFRVDSLEALQRDFDQVIEPRAYTFVVLEVERLNFKTRAAPFQGPELKRAFGSYVERTYGVRVFGEGQVAADRIGDD